MLNLSADLSAPQKAPHNSVTLSPIDTLRSMISPKLRAEGSGESSKPRILFSCLKQFFCAGGQPIPLLNSERRKNSEDLFGWAQEEAADEEQFLERRSKAKEAQVSVLDFHEDDLFCSKSDNAFLSPQDQIKPMDILSRSYSGESMPKNQQSKLKMRRRNKNKRKQHQQTQQ